MSELLAGGGDSKLLILGDSYSSGEGGGDYYSHTDVPGVNTCHRTDKSYLGGLGLNILNVACSGAVTANIYATESNGESPQARSSLISNGQVPVQAAFMTIGGNDIGFVNIIAACLLGSDIGPIPSCDKTFSWVLATIPLYKEAFKNAYAAAYLSINTKELRNARSGMIAPLVILPYVNSVPNNADVHCSLDWNERQFAQRVIGLLNHTIEKAVRELNEDGFEGILFAGPVRNALGRHGMCTQDPHFHTPSFAETVPDTIFNAPDKAKYGHPNAQGYADITRAIQAWSHFVNFDPTSTGFVDYVPLTSPTNPHLASTINIGSSSTVSVKQGDYVRVTASGLAPGSPVLISVSSIRYALGTAYADENGNLDTVVGVPDYIPVGSHHLVVDGFDNELNIVELSTPMNLGSEEPWWLLPGCVAAGTLLGLGMILILISHLTRKKASTP
jgi:lysophospholipase L1-like esterase